MSARGTRLLLLGGVAMFQPVNGYQIRRELVSWQVDRWANIKPGSIYHGLGRLSEERLLRRTDLVDSGRDVAVYEVTEAGRTELEAMLVAALETVDPFDRTDFHIGFGLLPLLDRERVLAALRRRLVALEASAAEFVAGVDDERNGPPHARRGWVLWTDIALAELGWLRDVIADVESRDLPFAADDDWGWTPPAEDPGWQMETDRQRYRTLLGR